MRSRRQAPPRRVRRLDGEAPRRVAGSIPISLQCFRRDAGPDAIHAALRDDGAVIIEGLLDANAVARINDEVEAAVAAVDPQAPLFNAILQMFHGAQTRQVSGVAGLSRAFAIEAMCAPALLALCDRVLLPACARYQLNIGHLLERGPGAEEQLLHRDEVVWSDLPSRGQLDVQLASVIALVDVTRDNGATRIVPGSHRWPDRALAPVEQALAAPPAIAATLPRQAQELLGYAVHDSIPRGGGYLGMVRSQDPVELLARGEL